MLQFCLVNLEKGIVTFSDRAICGLQRWGLAQSGPAYQNDVQRSAALPVSFDADTVCASQAADTADNMAVAVNSIL